MLVSFVFGTSPANRSYGRAVLFFFTLTLALLFFFVLLPPPARAVTYVSGTISQNTTWTTAGSPYVLTSNVTVAGGITLTVQPNVVVKPRQTSTALMVNGTLNATGAVFTSYKDDIHGGDTNSDGTLTSPGPGDWKNINFPSTGAGTISGCTILYGGYYYANQSEINIAGSSPTITGSTIGNSQTAGIYISSGSPSITNNTISGNQGSSGISSTSRPAAFYGNNIANNPNAMAVMMPSSLGQGAVYGNIYSGNKFNAMDLTGNVTLNTSLPASNSPYILGSPSGNSDISINNNSTLTVESGAIIKFGLDQTHHNSSLTIPAGGTLNATGAVFTSIYDDSYAGDTNGDGSATSPAPGDWKRIYFNGGTGTLSGCTILNGGYYYANYGEIYVVGSSPNITGSTVGNSQTVGIYISSGSPSITSSTVNGNQGSMGVFSSSQPSAFYGNNITNNPNAIAVRLPSTLGEGAVYGNTYSGNRFNAMNLMGNITLNTSWPASNSPYILGPTSGNHTLSIAGGSTLSVEPDTVVKFGTDHVHTGNRIEVPPGATFNATNAVFTSFMDDTYGGDTNADGDATSPEPGDWDWIQFSGGGGSISGCTLRYGGDTYAEIYTSNAASAPTITGSAISYSQNDGVYASSGSPSIHYSDIFANAGYGFRSSAALDATNNYWGSKHGPKPYGSGNGFFGVTAAPWSRIPFTEAGEAYQATLGTEGDCTLCGDPVNMSTGAFVYSHTDIDVPAKGLSLNFVRTYNSNDATDGPLGFGWSLNWQTSPNERANGDILMLWADGRRDHYLKKPDGSYHAPLGHINTLTKNPDGTFKLETLGKMTMNFDADNSLSAIVSESGQVTSMAYDSNKRLTAVNDPAGRSLSIFYNAEGRIDHVSDPANQTVSFGYSLAGDLTTVTDQSGGVTTYTYDAFHHIVSVTDPNSRTSANNTYDAQGRVTSQSDADGHLLSFTYDTGSRVTTMTQQMDPGDPTKDQISHIYYDERYRTVREIDALGRDTAYTYDGAGNRATITDRRGVVTRKVYDGAGNVTDIYKAYGMAEEQHESATFNTKNHPVTRTDARGYTTSYSYDASGTHVIQITYPEVTNYDSSTASYSESFTYNTDGTLATATDKNGDVTSYTYNSYGLVVSENKNTNRPAADQVTISYTYDNMGRKTSETDGNGHTATYQYDNLGNLRFVTKQVTDPATQQLVDVVSEYQYDGASNKVKEIDPEGNTTSYEYTAMNKLFKVTDAKLNTIEYEYDAAGNKTAVKDKSGNWSHFVFDKNNREASATDPENNTTTYTYDENGNQLSVTDALGHTRSKTYDALGRVTSSSEPDEGGATRSTTFIYDADDHLVTATDPLSHSTTNAYDELGRLKSDTDAVGDTSYYAYDAMGNRIKVKNGLGHETTFAYSPNDWLISVTDTANGVTSYTYDKAGNRTGQTDAENHVTLYSYDELNRISDEKVDAGGGTYLLEKSYAYDKAGHLKTDTTGAGTITNNYNEVYNLTGITDREANTYSFTYDANGNQLSATDDSAAKTVSFSYSYRGELSGVTDAFGATQAYTYDPVGNLAQQVDTVSAQNFTTTYDYTPRDQLKSVSRGTDMTSYTFDAARNLSTKIYANGVNTSYSYDADNRLTASSAVYGASTLQAFSQSYDNAGNIVSITDPVGTTTYGYDTLDRLTTENIAGYGTLSYSYDHAGNRLTLNSPVTGLTEYSYNEANQLTSSVNNSIPTAYSYDANGAIIQKMTGNDTTSYSYNGLDKLIQVVTPATTVSYGYDARGRRISRTQADATINYHHDAMSDLTDYDTDGAGNLTGAYVRGADGLISQADYSANPTATSYYLFNPHDDTTAQTDQAGVLTGTYHYDSFGNLISGIPPANGYTGKWQRESDYLTGTIRMGVREYSPELGKFVSKDSVKGESTNTQILNGYEYSINNPNKYNDTNGYYPSENAEAAVPDNSRGNASYAGDKICDSTLTNHYLLRLEHLDLDTANAIYNFGRGRIDVEVPASSVSGLRIVESRFDERGRFHTNLWFNPDASMNDRLVYGALDLRNVGNRRAEIIENRYDFDQKPNGPNPMMWLRNMGTALGESYAYWEGGGRVGIPYTIKFSGTIPIY